MATCEQADFRIGINGFGRIGRAVLRAIHERQLHQKLRVVVINEPTDLETLRYVTEYDSTHGRFPAIGGGPSVISRKGEVRIDRNKLYVNGQCIDHLDKANLAAIDWSPFQLDCLMECSGSYSDRATAEAQLLQGAGRILYSHPAQADVDATLIVGFNESTLTGEERILSAGSCSTNCIIPVLHLLDQAFSIERGLSTTIHSAMNDQPVIDAYHSNLRLTRAAVASIIPVGTQLSKGVARFLPHLATKLQSLHVRVPTLNVSAMDLSLQMSQTLSVEEVNQCLLEESQRIPKILGYSLEPHASVDFNHDPRSCIVDATQTRVSDGRLLKLFLWFDNEWGFANRMIDTALACLERAASPSTNPTTGSAQS